MGCFCCVAGGMQREFPWEMHTGWPGIETGAGSGLQLQVWSFTRPSQAEQAVSQCGLASMLCSLVPCICDGSKYWC